MRTKKQYGTYNRLGMHIHGCAYNLFNNMYSHTFDAKYFFGHYLFQITCSCLSLFISW